MKEQAWPEDTPPNYDTMKTEDDFVEHFGKDTPTAHKVVHVTNVNPYLPALDPSKVQIPFALLAVLVCLSALAVGEFIGLLLLR